MVAAHRFAWWKALALVALAAVTVATFAAVRRGGFVGIDDGNNIFLNPKLGVLNWDRVTWAFGDFGAARRYMPLGWLGFSAVYSWQGLAPAGYHLASLGWHVLAGLLLFLTAGNVLRATVRDASPGWIGFVAWFVAAAWSLHPLRTEAVAWASGLLYTQASAAALLAAWLWTLRWDFPARTGWLAFGSGVALAASLLTYPVALGLPVVCWLLDRCVASSKAPGPSCAQSASGPGWRPAGGRGLSASKLAGLLGRGWSAQIGRDVLGLAGVSALGLAAALLARGRNPAEFASVAGLSDFGLGARSLQALYVWGRYLERLVWPSDLSAIYTELYDLSHPPAWVTATAVLAAAMLVVAAWLAWRRRDGWVPVVAYTAMALPVLGLLEHPWVAHDRYAMLLHPVWLIAGGWWLVRIASPRVRLGVAVACAGLIGAGAFQAHALVAMWAGPERMEARLRQTLPRNAAAGYSLGYVPASVLFLEGRFAAIEPKLQEAEVRAPGWSADSTRSEIERLKEVHEAFVAANWPGRRIAPGVVLHYLHGREAQGQRDWGTARAHFAAATTLDPTFGEAGIEEAWCALEQLDLVAAESAGRMAIHHLTLAGSFRAREFWRVLESVYRSRGETSKADALALMRGSLLPAPQ